MVYLVRSIFIFILNLINVNKCLFKFFFIKLFLTFFRHFIGNPFCLYVYSCSYLFIFINKMHLIIKKDWPFIIKKDWSLKHKTKLLKCVLHKTLWTFLCFYVFSWNLSNGWSISYSSFLYSVIIRPPAATRRVL